MNRKKKKNPNRNFKKSKNKVINSQKVEYEKIQDFSYNQMVRYGFFRRADLKKEKIKKIMVSINPYLKNITSSDLLLISVKGLVKLFIGEIIEKAKIKMLLYNDSVDWVENPVQKNHIL